jgi:type I restriction enzyme S subunit
MPLKLLDMTQSKEIRWLPLGKFIEEVDERNSSNIFDLSSLKGISIEKKFIESKANMDGVSLTSYKLVRPNTFVYVTITSRNGEKITLALNESNDTYIVSSSYAVFRIKEGSNLLHQYLFMWFNMSEFDRYARYNSWGSAREAFSWQSMCLTNIPIPFKDGKPDIERQQEVVNIWDGLRKLRDDNLAIAEPLLRLCEAKVEELKKTTPMVELDKYIEEVDVRNTDLAVKLSQGISNNKHFQAPKQVAANSTNDKIVRTGQFAYNRATTRNGEKISIAFREGEDCTVSSAYGVFQLKNNNSWLPNYLMLWFSRPEFDRYARYKSKGSAHEFFEFEEMRRVKVPKASIEVQQAIVDIYKCAKRAKDIAADADKQLKTICPALLQYVIHN